MTRPRFNRFTDELREAEGDIQLRLPSGFDAILPPRDQERFLRDPSYADAEGERVDDFPLRLKYGNRYTTIQKMPAFEQAIAVTRQYVQTCIPAYVHGEKDYWEVTGRMGGRWAVLRVNMNWNVTYDVYTDWQGNFSYCWFLWQEQLTRIAAAPLNVEPWPPQPIPLALANGRTTQAQWRRSGMVAGGADQIALLVFTLHDALTLLNDDAMIRAARIFALNLARMGRTPYARYHCFDLADRLVEP